MRTQGETYGVDEDGGGVSENDVSVGIVGHLAVLEDEAKELGLHKANTKIRERMGNNDTKKRRKRVCIQ